MLNAFFWVILRRLNFMCHRFGTLCSIFIGLWRWNRQGVPKRWHIRFRRPCDYPEESIQHSEHGENLKSRGVKPTAVVSLLLTLSMCIAVPTLLCKLARRGDALNVELISLILYGIYVPIVCKMRPRWSRGSVLAFSTQVRGFKPGRSRRIFRAKKSTARLPSEGK